jgi:hypothetical protein
VKYCAACAWKWCDNNPFGRFEGVLRRPLRRESISPGSLTHEIDHRTRRRKSTGNNGRAAAVRRPEKIWIDLDNSPHVPFFAPIIPELQARGFEIFLTARDSYQVVGLLKYYKIPARVIGKHSGKLKIMKLLSTA